MKKLIPILFSAFFITVLGGCYSAQSSYTKGNYDKAIQLAARKLRKKPDDQKMIDILANSWEISNRTDKSTLNNQLSASNPDWEGLYATYKRLDDRQKVVMQLPRLHSTNPQTNVDFQFEDYSTALNNAKDHAIQKLTQQGDELMSRGDRFNARDAYNVYMKAYGYDNSNTNVKAKADQAYLMGITHVLVQITPTANLSLPANFTTQALNKTWNNLESNWLRIHNAPQNGMTYHYYSDVLINSIVVTPEQIAETSYVETQQIQDGWEYVKNGDGSVRTDSAGNKLQQPVYRTVSCTVVKYTLTKQATINGTVMIYGTDSDKKYANDPIYGTFAYNYTYGIVKGDSRALSKTSSTLVNSQPGTFPTNSDMVMGASTNFGNAIYDKVNQYKSVFQ